MSMIKPDAETQHMLKSMHPQFRMGHAAARQECEYLLAALQETFVLANAYGPDPSPPEKVAILNRGPRRHRQSHRRSSMNSLDAFAGAPIRMRDAPFARLRDTLGDVVDLLTGRLDEGWWQQLRANRWALSACRAANDFEAAGDDRSAAACRCMAREKAR
jgi:hypothetical protein